MSAEGRHILWFPICKKQKQNKKKNKNKNKKKKKTNKQKNKNKKKLNSFWKDYLLKAKNLLP